MNYPQIPDLFPGSCHIFGHLKKPLKKYQLQEAMHERFYQQIGILDEKLQCLAVQWEVWLSI
jgi:hypothetical protein